MPCAIAIFGTFLPVPNTLPGSGPSAGVVAVRAVGGSPTNAARPCSCSLRCRSRCRARHRCARTCRRGSRSRCPSCRHRRLARSCALLASLHPHGGGNTGGDRGRIAKQRVQPRDLPRRLRIGRREHFEAARGVDRNELAVRRAHRRIDRVAAPSASPHPWQARWPQVSAFERSSRPEPSAAASETSRLPTVKCLSDRS